jgi:serine/threonine-protein kinase
VADPPPTPEPPEPVAEQPEPLPTPDPTPALVAKKERAPARPIQLTPRVITTVLKQHHGKLLNCGQQFRSEIPADRRVKMLMTIKNSGEVRDVTVSASESLSPGLAKCLEDRLKQARFPLNTHQPEFKIEVPLRFEGD